MCLVRETALWAPNSMLVASKEQRFAPGLHVDFSSVNALAQLVGY